MVRQLTNEPGRVAEQYPSPIFDVPLTRSRIQRRKEAVLYQHGGAGEGVHQRALAGVRIANERNGVFFPACRDFSLLAGLQLGKAMAKIADAVIDESAVFFE